MVLHVYLLILLRVTFGLKYDPDISWQALWCVIVLPHCIPPYENRALGFEETSATLRVCPLAECQDKVFETLGEWVWSWSLAALISLYLLRQAWLMEADLWTCHLSTSIHAGVAKEWILIYPCVPSCVLSIPVLAQTLSCYFKGHNPFRAL